MELNKLRREGKGKPLEMRKFMKSYLGFLKNSQRFYREHIQKLNAAFGGIPALEAAAHQVKADGVATYPVQSLSSMIQEQVLTSCYLSLIYLGDLSRYRAAERLDKDPSWAPAVGYYGLASTIRPSSGMAHHQLAVIAREEGTHLRAIYHLYRAMVVNEPHPNAPNNIEVEFKKVIHAWNKGDLIASASSQEKSPAFKALTGWFVRFHSMCYKGEEFPTHNELEQEVLNQLALEIKKPSAQSKLESTLHKIVMTNLAAEYYAAEQLQKRPDLTQYLQSYFYFLRLNVKTFTLVLQAFYADLQNESRDDPTNLQNPTPRKLSDSVTVLARRVLAVLRLYSSWFLINAHILVGGVGDDALKLAIAQLWKVYANTLTLLASRFPVQDLPIVCYQLDEDADALGFKPLISDKTKKIWIDPKTGSLKPKFSDEGSQQELPHTEMLARMRELLIDGLLLAADDTMPITLTGLNFVYEGADAASVHTAPSMRTDSATQKAKSHATEPTLAKKSAPSADDEIPPHTAVPRADPASDSRDAQLSRMVDDLVDEEDDDQPTTPPAPAYAELAIFTNTGDTSSYPIGTETASDLASLVQNYRSSKTSSARPMSSARTRPIGGLGQMEPPAMQRLSSVSSLWDDAPPARQLSPSTPFSSGLMVGTRSSPKQYTTRGAGHSRVNSTTSTRSRSSQKHMSDSWSSLEPGRFAMGTPPGFGNGTFAGYVTDPGRVGRGNSRSILDQSGMMSPLLFGAGGGPWSTTPQRSLGTPANGQVG
ncbi:hypothetical protein LTR66_002906 [Elasticomyces elasticus]|nr:hypothetical protein LTR66_002906 [Elasticomyces elasticus]